LSAVSVAGGAVSVTSISPFESDHASSNVPRGTTKMAPLGSPGSARYTFSSSMPVTTTAWLSSRPPSPASSSVPFQVSSASM
jgi:hypothetical protein